MTKIHLSNDSQTTFSGWMMVNVDVLPPHPRGDKGGEWYYILGNASGLDTHNLDIFVPGLAPGERKTIDLTEAQPIDYNPHAGMFPQNAGMWGGVAVSVAGVALEYKGGQENGAAFDGHWRGRVTPMLHVDLYLHWYPDAPGWCTGEIIIDASNPSVPDVIAWIPGGMRLVFGDALVMVPGLPHFSSYLMEEVDWLADGQCRMLPLVLCWLRHGGNLDMARAVADQLVCANGLKQLHADGNPHLPEGFDARAWARDMRPKVIDAMHHWRNSPLDPAMVSGATGAQGAQSFVGGPAMADPLAAGVFYLAALDGSWPMHHLEQSGDPLDWKGHPNLHLNYGRVNRAISSDTLGKDHEPTMADSHGYRGPEWEHWFDWVMFAGNRLKGTPATQWMLRHHAIHFLHNFNVSWSPPNRGIGWYSFLAVELWRGLADRDLAEAVKAKWLELWTRIIQPKFANEGFWSWTTDARIGASEGNPRAVPWQAAVAALGLDWAAFAFMVEDAWNLAAHMAAEIMDKAYEKQPDGRWASKPIIAQDGSFAGPYEQYGVRMGYYDGFGMPMAVACALRHNPTHWVAREVWAQLKRESTTWEQCAWLQPGLEVQP